MTREPGAQLSGHLRFLLEEAHGGLPLTLREIEERLRGRGFALLILLLAAPFLVPNLPGLSTPFGLAICIMGARLAVGQKPWLPAAVLDRKLAPQSVERILCVLIKIAQWMERLSRPRLRGLWAFGGFDQLIGLGIVSGGVFLLLPLPIPFTNTLPAASILLLTAGMMERDGLAAVLGGVIGVLAWGYLTAWLLLGKAGMEWLRHLWL